MKIAIISQPEYFRAFYENDLDELGEVREFPFKFTMKEGDFAGLQAFDADYNIFFRGEYIPRAVVQRLKGCKIGLSSEPFPNYIGGRLNYTADSLARFDLFKHIATREFDYVFHYDRTSLPFLAEKGMRLSGEFVFPVALSVYRKKDLAKKWDVFFIGRSTEYRERFLGLPKHCLNVLHIAHGIFGPDLVDFINQSRLVLNLHAENEISWEPRVQMLLACGGMLLSHRITENDYLTPGVDYIEIDQDDHHDLFAKIEYYLAHEDERAAIAENGWRKVQGRLNALENFRSLLDGIQSGRFSRAQFDLEKIFAEDKPVQPRSWKSRLGRLIKGFRD